MVQTMAFSLHRDSSIQNAADYIAEYIKQQWIRAFSEADKAGGTLPTGLIDRYVLNAMLRASLEQMEDGRYFAEVPGLQGVWADGDSEQAAYNELHETLQAWLKLKIDHADRDIPKIAEIDLNVI